MADISPVQKQKLSKSKLSAAWRWAQHHPTTFFGITVVSFFLLLAFIGPYLAPYHFAAQNLAEKLQPPSARHFFGTDQFGRDIFSRILVGSRGVFIVAGSGSALAVFLGSLLGLVSGYRGGIADEILMRLLDVILSIPPLLLAMVILFSLGPSKINVIIVVGFLYIPMVARVVRSVVLDLKTRQFVEAARLRGESSTYILLREILPNVLPYLAVEGSMRFSYAIFLVASLGFLGMGVQPPAPDWGLMVGEARNWFQQAQWILYFPAGTIALLVVGVGFFSDGLRTMLLPGGVSDE